VWKQHDLTALQGLYEQVDQVLSGWTCEASTDCCHFGRTGREPYLWPNEWALVERALAARGISGKGRRTRRGRGSLAVLTGTREGSEERRCPLLADTEEGGRCTIYDSRPFGCRTFFCDRASGPTRKLPRAEVAELGKQVAQLARESDPRCDGPSALTRLLGSRGR
jgi:Fe-S-cluster containining protein